MPAAASPPGRRLDSWKDIAAYVGREVRTVQRWEKSEGLPVHRHHHNDRSSVFAYSHEIDAWLQGREGIGTEEPKSAAAPGRRKGWAALALSAAGASLFLLVGARAPARRPEIAVETQQVAWPGARLLAKASSEGGESPVVPTGRGAWDLALSEDGSRLYVSNTDEDFVSVVETATLRVIDRLVVGAAPGRLLLLPDGTLLVARRPGGLAAIAPRSRRAEVVDVGGEVTDLLHADGWVYLALKNAGLKRVRWSDRRVERLPSVACPMYLAFVPGRGRLFVSHQCGGPGGRPGHDAIDSLDVASGQYLGVMQGPPNVGGVLAVSPDGRQLWASGEDACSAREYDRAGCPVVPGNVANVFRIDDRVLLRTLGSPESGGWMGLLPLPDGARILLTSPRAVAVHDLRSFAELERLELAVGVGRPAVSRDGGRLYLPLGTTGGVGVYDAMLPEPVASRASSAWMGDGTPSDAIADHHVVPVGEVGFEAGRIGRAFRLRGGYLSLGKREPASLESDPATMTAWVKPEGDGREMTLAARTDESGNGWRWWLDREGAVAFCMGACGAGAPPTVAVPACSDAGRWSFVAVARGARDLTLHCDARQASVPARPRYPPVAGEEWQLGAWRGRIPFVGLLDEIAVHAQALSAPDVGRLAAAGATIGPRRAR